MVAPLSPSLLLPLSSSVVLTVDVLLTSLVSDVMTIEVILAVVETIGALMTSEEMFTQYMRWVSAMVALEVYL